MLKHYDEPQTPYKRLLASGASDDARQDALLNQYQNLNPAELQRKIESTLRRLWPPAAHRHQESRSLGNSLREASFPLRY